MNFQGLSRKQGQRQTVALATFMLLQGLAAVFFIGDAFADLVFDASSPHSILEAFVALVLIVGIFMAGWQLRVALERLQEQERALLAARGELSRIIEHQFDQWGLTPAEREVGLFTLKGLDLSEIAGLRGAAQGTVRAQLARIYAKAGVSGRHQFAAWFVEDLLIGPVSPQEAPAEPSVIPQ